MICMHEGVSGIYFWSKIQFENCIQRASLAALGKSRTNLLKACQNLKNTKIPIFVKSAQTLAKHPNASECNPAGPNESEHVGKLRKFATTKISIMQKS